MQVVRFTIDLFRPVPLTALEVRCDIVRSGRRIQVVQTSLTADGVEVARATALRIRIADTSDLPESEPFREVGIDQLAPPEEAEPVDWQGRFGAADSRLLRFHNDAVEIRTFDDSFVLPGEGRSWVRLRYPIIAGETVSPFGLVATIADLGNGNSQNLDPSLWLYINADITVSLERLPIGEWVGLKSVARQGEHGIGVADSLVFDRVGLLGRVLQSQVVERHPS